MIRFILLAAGCILLIVQHFIQPVSAQAQLLIFLSGILLLGVPHGAADLLVAMQNAGNENKYFSKFKFFFNYLGRLILFAAILFFFPSVGMFLFIIFAAYHFGETDLYQFKTNTIAGKIFVISYGLVILGVILLHHFEEVKPILQLFDTGNNYDVSINWIGHHRYIILSFAGLLFFVSTFLYFVLVNADMQNPDNFLIQFTVILFLLYNLPLVMGFTFYFVIWHSVLSMRNIIGYLHRDGSFANSIIIKQIAIYSLLAIMGISIIGLTGSMFATNNSMLLYVFIGLAVLTAPHMQIMHDMYNRMRHPRTM